MYNQSLTYHYYNVIRRYIAGGIDPRKDPELSAAYYALVDELGDKLFIFEMDDGTEVFLTLENDSDIS